MKKVYAAGVAAEAAIAGTLLILMVALIFLGGVMRMLGHPINWSTDAATAFFALVPALQATRIEPVRTLRGELVKDARPGRARNILIGVQVFASALLLICSAVFLRSAMASSQDRKSVV